MSLFPDWSSRLTFMALFYSEIMIYLSSKLEDGTKATRSFVIEKS